MKSFSRFFRVSFGASVLASFTLVACVSSTPGSVAGASPSTGKPHHGGTLTIAIGTEPPTLNHEASDDTSITPVQRLIENMLVVENAKSEIVPSLATSWSESKNGLTYTIKLRQGVKWSDGVPFTSKDVVYTLEKAPPGSPSISPTFPKVVKSVKAIGKYVVVITLKHPYAPLLTLLAETFFVMPEHIYGNQTVIKDTQANTHPIGTGPFILKQWIPTQKIVLVRNPHYWGATKKGLPWFNRVVVDIITNPQTIVDNLLNGTIDYVPTTFLPLTSITQIRKSSCCRVVAIHGTPVFGIMFTNTARPPFNNLTVRRAVYMAITRKLVLQDALAGYGTLPLAPIPPSYGQLYTPKINLMNQYPYDPAKAAKILDSAGYPVKNGERFGKAITLLYTSITGPVSTETAAIFKSELAKLTIKVNLVNQDLTSWAAQTYLKKNFTLSFIGYTTSNDPALGGIQKAFACLPPTPTVEYLNPTGFCNKRVTSLFQAAVTASTVAGRQRDYAKAQKVIDSQLPAYEMGWRETFVAISKRIQNWRVSLLSWGGNFNTTWSQAWFSK